MNNGIGSSLKTVAKVVAVLTVLAALASGIFYAISIGKATAIACAETNGWSYRKNDAAGVFAGIGVFILIAGGGILCARVSFLALTALGEIVENSHENRRMLQQLLHSSRPTADPADIRSAPAAANDVETASKPAAPAKSSIPKPAVVPTPLGEGKIRCPHCGAVQPADRFVCWDCGVKFTSNSPSSAPSAQTVPTAPKPEPAPEPPKPEPVPEPPQPEPAPEPPKPVDASWTCPNCSTSNVPDARFCYRCGTRKP